MMRIPRIIKTRGSLILTITACFGIGATAVTTGIASFKAKDALDKAKEDKGEELTSKEKVRVAAPFYIVPASVGLATAAAVVGGHAMDTKAKASLIATGGAAYKALDYYKDIARNNVPSGEEINVNNPNEEVELFYEPFTETYLQISEADVLKALLKLNEIFVETNMATLDDWLGLLGIHSKPFTELGWCAEKIYTQHDTGFLRLFFIDEESSDGKKFTSINFEVTPTYLY